MTGRFSVIDDQRCVYYARFLSGLSLPQANGLYWGLFMFVLLILCVAANIHNKSVALQAEIKNKRDERRIRKVRKRLLGFVTLLFLVASVCAVIEVFALLNIQFCDGEDLIVLYWSFWGFLQTGSIIAVFGVVLNLWIALADVHTPGWAVALGTPVLVFAALHWILQFLWRRFWARFTGKDEAEKDQDDTDESDVEEGSITEEGRRELDVEVKRDMDRWTSTAPTIAPLHHQPTSTRGSIGENFLMPTMSRRSSI